MTLNTASIGPMASLSVWTYAFSTLLVACESTPAHPDSKPAPSDLRVDVVIVGAGAAGLAAARRLDEAGLTYQILEATDRMGGRIQRDDTFADFPIDLGAEWIHTHKSVLNRLIDLPGEEPELETILYQPMDIYLLSPSSFEKYPEESLADFYQTYVEEYKFKQSTWHEYLMMNFSEDAASHVVYNASVTMVETVDDGVILTTSDGIEYAADQAIVTVSVGVLQGQHITFSPPLSTEKQTAIDSVEFLPGFKLFMKFEEQFYPDVISCSTALGEKTYYDVAYHKDAEDHVLGLLSTGATAEEYYELGSTEAIVEAVLAELDPHFGGAASTLYTGDFLVQEWGQPTTTLGTWTSNYASPETIEALKEPLDDTVFFAGETYPSDDPEYPQVDMMYMRGSVHGAILSGYAAAEAVRAVR